MIAENIQAQLSTFKNVKVEVKTVEIEGLLALRRTFDFDATISSAFFQDPEPRLARPSTRDVLFCHGALAAPNDGVTGPVAAVLGAGFNRSTLLTQPAQAATDAAGFYRDPTTNRYARALHKHTDSGRAYGFAFDDVAGFASYIQDTAPVAATLRLTPF